MKPVPKNKPQVLLVADVMNSLISTVNQNRFPGRKNPALPVLTAVQTAEMRRKFFRPIEMHDQDHVFSVFLVMPQHLVPVVHAACCARPAKGMEDFHLRTQPPRNDSRSLNDRLRWATENLCPIRAKHFTYPLRQFFVLPFAEFRH